jgi:hypothetical protein
MSATFATGATVRARKAHQCGECFRQIEPGEHYVRNAGKWEGDFWSMKTCAHCDAFRKMVGTWDSDYHEDYYGGLHVWVGEIGTCPRELTYYKFPSPLSIYRWSRWFQTRWRYPDGSLRPIPALPPKESSPQ